jgi:dTDP-4-dehydrorhamnose 3,5-epimerase
MADFKVKPTHIEGLVEIFPQVFGDERGYFMETFNAGDFTRLGLETNFVQDNQSHSRKGVLRGLHFQTQHQQGKLVRCLTGQVFDVAVDLRQGSPTYGQYASVILDGEQKNMFYVPPGFAHGFLVLTETATFTYKCTDLYHPEFEGGLPYNDPDLDIDWPLEQLGDTPVSLSEKDQKWLPFAQNRLGL